MNIDEINKKIADRNNVFYWQTDRAVDPKQAGVIWADRHAPFNDQEIIDNVNRVLKEAKLESLVPLDLDAQTNLGNVNSVRVGQLSSGKQVIIRLHPKGLVNGYFHAESLAAQKAVDLGLPSYRTLAIHDFEGGDDFSFQVIEKLEGKAMKVWLDEKPEDEAKLVFESGIMMAKMHKIQVDGFGPFDNQKAKEGKLVGLHPSLASSYNAGLDFNLEVLVSENIIPKDKVVTIKKLFNKDNPLLSFTKPVIIHNDFADWNVLTNGNEITGILDWDECVGGDPICDIACWSTFFEPERMEKFLEGYWSVAEKPKDFEEKFELFRLRYTLSKMTLRTRRYSWDPSESVKEKIESGRIHLKASFKYFEI